MAKNLWMTDVDGERWLINPSLVIANPRRTRKLRRNRKRGLKMARRHRRARRNRMPAGLARYWAKHRANPRRKYRRNRIHHRRRSRRNYASAGMIASNRRRHHRRHYRRNRVHRRRHARRNPVSGTILGFSIPPMMDIVGVGAGLIATPMLANYAWNSFIVPNNWTTSKYAYLGVTAASAVLPGWLVKRFAGNPRIGNLMILGGLVSFAMTAVQTLAPGMLPATAVPTGLSGMGSQPFLGYYETMPMLRPNVPRRGLLGRYYSPGSAMENVGKIITGAPERLDPQARF